MKSNLRERVLRNRHVPQRSCVVCREVKAKGRLIRLVCNDGVVEVDTTGKKAGRGAYLCPIYECWEKGLKRDRLEYPLRAKITVENCQMLLEYGESLPKRGETQG